MEINYPIDHDTHWKAIIKDLFEDFILFFLPEAHPLIDFTKPVEFLEQELHKIIADNSKKGKVVNDKLAKVQFKDGAEQWILIHIEVQSNDESAFSRRMFTYFYRIFDQYAHNMTAIAIYTSERVPKSYNQFEYNFLGTRNVYEFNTYLIREAKEELLITSNNPFALAVLATKYHYQSTTDVDARFAFKRKLLQLTKEKHYTQAQILGLFKFISLVLALPKPIERKFFTIIQDMNQSEYQDLVANSTVAQALFEVLYGESKEAYEAKIKQEAVAKEAKIKQAAAVKEAKIKQEAAARESNIRQKIAAKAAEQKEKERHILKMLLLKGMEVGELAIIMDLSEEYVQEVKAEMDKDNSDLNC